MAINKKKKRRKKRSPQPVEVESIPNPEEEKKVQYKDDFQKTFGQKVEDFAEQFAGKGKAVLIGVIGIVVIGGVIGYFYYSAQATERAGRTALGQAIVTASARITDVPLPAGSTEKVFKTKKDRAEAAIKEFDAVIATYGGETGAKASYFKAITRVDIDREAGAKELATVAAKGGEAGALAKFALAGIRADDEKYEEAIKLYKELLAIENPVVSKLTVNTSLAAIYEKTGKKKEAAKIYFDIAKASKDAEKPAADNATALAPPPLQAPSELEAKSKLEELDPELAKKLDEPAPSPPAEKPAEKKDDKKEEEKK